MEKKKATVSIRECVACGCCMKVCPRGAITIPRGINPKLTEISALDVENVLLNARPA